MSLAEAIRGIMKDPAVMAKYTKGISGAEMLTEVQTKYDGFELVSVLDVIDFMRDFYGPGDSAA